MLKIKSRKSATKASTKSMGSSPRKSGPKERSSLRETWYAGGVAKRNFGNICQRVQLKSDEIGLLGSREQPLLILVDAKFVARSRDEIEISVAEAKANWSAVTAAALFCGTSFRIMGKKLVRAVLSRHKVNRHTAIHKYYRQEEEKFLKNADRVIQDLREICKRFESTAEIINRRFREVWRENDGLSNP